MGAKYIFLDFDGPLNTGRNDYLDPERYGHHFDNVAVNNLRRIIDRTGAGVVVSSSWRHLGLPRLKEIWEEWGMPGKIIGCTPGLWGDGRIFDTRGEEIKQWLEENASSDYSFVVIDDMDESEALEEQKEYWIRVDPHCGISYEDSDYAIGILNKEENCLRRKRRMKLLLIIIASLILCKALWVLFATRNIGSLETEKKDILRRRDYLISEVIIPPRNLIDRMPSVVGAQFQGEWALYSCSMLSASLVNIAYLYPETKEKALVEIGNLIEMVISPELRRYDCLRWGEDPLETLDGDESHISYLSHLAWMIAGYKQIGGDARYDNMYHSICAAMNRRLLSSTGMNLQTYPGEYVYIPDMLVAIVALKLYSRQNGGQYGSTVQKWLDNMKENHLSESLGIIASMVIADSNSPNCITVKGSYTALSCYYLTFIDEAFARDQFQKFKDSFLKRRPICGFKEYANKSPLLAMDIDAGPIVFGLSPTGTAFGIGPASFFKDSIIRKRFLRTAELAGTSVAGNGKTHYLLANIALVGEAITLAMRTATPWN